MAARRALGAVVLTLAALSACSSSGTPESRTSSLYIPSFGGAGRACDFVPTSAVRRVTGTTPFETAGEAVHDSISVSASCEVRTKAGDPLLTVQLSAPASSTTKYPQLAQQIKDAPPDWTIFPSSVGTGFAAPRVPGSHGRGAKAVVNRGDYGLLVDTFGTGPDAHEIALAVEVAEAVFDSLHIPAASVSGGPSPSD